MTFILRSLGFRLEKKGITCLKLYFIKIEINSINYIFIKLCSVLHESSKKLWSWIKIAEILYNDEDLLEMSN